MKIYALFFFNMFIEMLFFFVDMTIILLYQNIPLIYILNSSIFF
jgi:hypothetical protein